MTQTRILEIRFRNPLPFALIPAFRGAVASESGFKNILFHNHIDTGYRYRYPLIQYKRIGGCPALICINDGVDEVYEFFRKRKQSVFLNGHHYPLDIGDISLRTWRIDRQYFRHRYFMSNWMALNQVNYQRFKILKSEEDRIELLEGILAGNIKSMGKGLGIWFERPPEVKIHPRPEFRNGKFKNKNVILFHVEFSCNVSIPNYLGLGKGVSTGYGVLHHLKKEERLDTSIKAMA